MSTDKEKAEWMVKHLTYQYQMLEHTIGQLALPRRQLDWNVFFDSFSLHARGLYQFLASDAEPGSPEAKDYVPSFASKKTPFTKSIFQRMLWQVLHPAERRLTLPSKQISREECVEFADWIRAEFKLFIESLPEPYRSEWRWPERGAANFSPGLFWQTSSFESYSFTPDAGLVTEINVARTPFPRK